MSGRITARKILYLATWNTTGAIGNTRSIRIGLDKHPPRGFAGSVVVHYCLRTSPASGAIHIRLFLFKKAAIFKENEIDEYDSKSEP